MQSNAMLSKPKQCKANQIIDDDVDDDGDTDDDSDVKVGRNDKSPLAARIAT